MVFSWSVTNPHQPFPKVGYLDITPRLLDTPPGHDKRAIFFYEEGCQLTKVKKEKKKRAAGKKKKQERKAFILRKQETIESETGEKKIRVVFVCSYLFFLFDLLSLVFKVRKFSISLYKLLIHI